MFLPILYAETHYRFKFLIPLYFKKEPEILFDLPRRVISTISPDIPVLLIIKDASKFPIFLKKITINILSSKGKMKFTFELNLLVKKNYFSKIFFCKPDNTINNEYLSIYTKLDYISNQKNRTLLQDNYFGLRKLPFVCYYTNELLPFPKDWYAGDVHYHSNYTSDQVEFGADIFSTKVLAKSMGLKWFFVTDHSYDLDDYENNYLKKDPELQKWKSMINTVKKNSDNSFKIIFGEELSVGNSKNQNVHMLIMNSDDFFCGSGDSAENWFDFFPENKINQLINKNKNALYIAAHPFEKVPFIQKILLNRGSWLYEDFKDIVFLQLINGNNDDDIHNLISKWKRLLLNTKKKYFILAGNDAHGNFNYMKQIKFPFIKLFLSDYQTFGKWMTVFNYDKNDPIYALKKGNIIVTNGPFLNIKLIGEKKTVEIGNITVKGKYEIIVESRSTKEFGKIKFIKIWYGVYKKGIEILLKSNKKSYKLDKEGYIRAELITEKGYGAFTNPIWLE